MIYRIIFFLVIVIAVITYIVISKREYKRLLKKEMEDIQNRNLRREMLTRVDRENLIIGRGYTRTDNLDESQINTIIENAEAIVESRNLKPYKHIKRHSIR